MLRQRRIFAYVGLISVVQLCIWLAWIHRHIVIFTVRRTNSTIMEEEFGMIKDIVAHLSQKMAALEKRNKALEDKNQALENRSHRNLQRIETLEQRNAELSDKLKALQEQFGKSLPKPERLAGFLSQRLNIAPRVLAAILVQGSGGSFDRSGAEFRMVDPLHGRTEVIPPPFHIDPEDYDADAASIGVHEKLFLLGLQCRHGAGGNYDARNLRCYSRPAKTWSKLPSMSVARCDFACAQLGKYLYVAGGRPASGDGAFRGAERFDIKDNKWEETPFMNWERFLAFGCAIDERFYVLGGFGGNGAFVHSGEVLDPETRVWSVIPYSLWRALVPRDGTYMLPSLTVVKNKLYALTHDCARVVVYEVHADVSKPLIEFAPPRHCSWARLLGVGEDLWVIYPFLPEGIRVMSCRPGDRPVKWSRVHLGWDDLGSRDITCTTLTVGL